MPDAGAQLAAAGSGGHRRTDLPPDPGLGLVLMPKLLTIRSKLAENEKGRGLRLLLLGATGAFFWLVVFVILVRLLRYFRNDAFIGNFLAAKLLSLILVGFFAILLLSNIISALSTFFLARDLETLVAAPVDWMRVYLAKLIETGVHSSWMVVLMSIPIFTAFGVAYDAGPLFAVVVLFGFIPYLVLPSVIGTGVTLALVNIFPARRTKDLLTVIAVLAGAGLLLLFRLIRPEQLTRPESYDALVEFVAVLRTPTSPFLPSDWLQRGLMNWLTGETDVLPFYLLWTTAGALIVLGALMHKRLYTIGFTRAQESGIKWARHGPMQRAFIRLLGTLGPVRRELVLKEMRVFFRDTTQWSQLILLAVLVVVYVFNVKYLPLNSEGVTTFLLNVVPFLNMGLSGFVIASIAARFIFPSVSLEGRTLWLLRSSPLNMKQLLWAKFWVGTTPLLIVAVLIVFLTNALLRVDPFVYLVSVVSITLMTFAVASLALCLGTIFPQFEVENAAQIPTSFGGLVFMMTSVALIGIVVWLEMDPAYRYLRSAHMGDGSMPEDLPWRFGAAALLCVLATVVPGRIALKRLESTER